MTNTLSYNGTKIITAIKRFIVQVLCLFSKKRLSICGFAVMFSKMILKPVSYLIPFSKLSAAELGYSNSKLEGYPRFANP
jgi:hypothetical protein